MRIVTLLSIASLILALPRPLAAQTTWHVDDDAPRDPGPGDATVSDPREDGSAAHPFDAIQKAIDAAEAGEEVIVADGVYAGVGNRRIFHKAGVLLRSRNGPQACIVELAGTGPGFYFVRHEAESATLDGFTIQNGTRGIQCSYSSPVIRRCIVRGNRSSGDGAGISAYASSPTIIDCVIADNHAWGYGGGISVDNNYLDQRVTIENCLIRGNNAAASVGGAYIRARNGIALRNCVIVENVAEYYGGGAVCWFGSQTDVRVEGCTIAANRATPSVWTGESYGGGLVMDGNVVAPHAVLNCVFWGNEAGEYPQVMVNPDGTPHAVAYCVIQPNQEFGPTFHEIISADPAFVNPGAGDYHLLGGSPAIGAGDPDFAPSPGSTDIDGQPRAFDGRVDIGADERYPYTDCNHNGIDDVQDLASGVSADCNANSVPDECEGGDCNGNATLDACDIASGVSEDCDANGMPDECQRDCNANGRADACDITAGSSADANQNSVPDECEYAPRIIYVDDDASGDPCPGDPQCGDALEDGSAAHPFDAIQEAIDASQSGDEVVLRAGVYRGVGNRDIRFGGHRIRVHGPGAPADCTIDCEGEGIGFRFYDYETPDTRLEGVTIRNGWSEHGSCAIDCRDSSPTIHNCVITQNRSIYGGAVYFSGGRAIISNCRITHNDGSISGYGAITCADGAAPYITNCLLAENDATWHGGVGCYHASTPTITNCTIIGNRADYYSGGVYCYNSNPSIRNCIFWNNQSRNNLDVYPYGGSHPFIDYCIVSGELPAGVNDGGHNLRLDPRLLDSNTADLANTSPCIDAGDPESIALVGEIDLNGRPRMAETRVDIGAVEYEPQDCNANGVPDGVDIDGGASMDCDADGTPDECQFGGTVDCDENGTPDLCDIASGASQDCNQNVIADVCEPGGNGDCDGDGISDLCEILAGSAEANANRVPDVCEPVVILHVDDNGPGDPGPGDAGVSDPEENGTAEHPYDAIQEALNNAPNGDAAIVTIVVANGTYTGVGNRDLDFGGKALTLRSANGPQTCIIDAQQSGRCFDFHNLETPVSVLRGFTIRGGRAEWGAGIRCHNSAPTIQECIISGNETTGWCSIGGALYFWNHEGHTLVLRDCQISGNVAGGDAGGLSLASGASLLINCVIAGNRCDDPCGGGGGIQGRHDSIIHLINCLVVGNESRDAHLQSGRGGGIGSDGAMLTIDNCTIVDNRADFEGGVSGYCNLVIRNSIVWNNSPAHSQVSESQPLIAFSAIEGGLPAGTIDGGGNTVANPRFVDRDGADNAVATWQDNNYRVLPDSPCIDAADNTAIRMDIADIDDDADRSERTPIDLDRRPRFVQYPFAPDTGRADPPRYRFIADMGAYEFPFCFGDLNGDDSTNVNDLAVLLGGFGRTQDANYEDGDLDGDADVDVRDLSEILALLYADRCG